MAPTDRDPPDEELLRLFLAHRDVEAFEGLVERYQAFAYRVAYSVGGKEAIAEEAVQEAFVRLAKSYGRVQAEKIPLFQSWFFGLVVNSTRYVLRTEQRKDRKIRLFKDQQMQEYSDAPEIESERKEQQQCNRAALLDALSSLGDEMRVPIVLHYLEGVKQSDICTLFGVSQSQISRRITQGLELLRKRLAGSGVVVPMAVLAELLQDQNLLPNPANGSLAQVALNLLSKPHGAMTSAKYSAKKAAAWPLWLAGAIMATTACVLLLPPRATAGSSNKPVLPVPEPEPAPKLAPEASAKRIQFKSVWSCETKESLQGIQIDYGQMEFMPGRGKGGNGCMLVGPDKTKLIFSVPHAAQPLRLTYACSPSPAVSCGVFWNKYQGWGSAFFQNLAKTRENSFEYWFTHTVYISDHHSDYYTDGKRTAFAFTDDSKIDEFCLCFSGRGRIANIVIESVDPSEVPEYRKFQEAFDRVPPNARKGSIPLPDFQTDHPAGQVYLIFTGPVEPESWKQARPSNAQP